MAQSTLALAITKDSEEKLEHLRTVLGPALASSLRIEETMRSFRIFEEQMAKTYEPITRMAATIAKTMEPVLRFQKEMAEMAERHQRWMKSLQEPIVSPELFAPHETIRYVPEREQRLAKVKVELSDQQCERIGSAVADALVERGITVQVHTTSAQIDLQYDRKTRTITRHVGTNVRSMRFDGKEENKRREAFEKIAFAGRPVDTHELKDLLGCSSIDATYKVLQGLNKKMCEELGLSMDFADGREKRGYHVHDLVAVHAI